MRLVLCWLEDMGLISPGLGLVQLRPPEARLLHLHLLHCLIQSSVTEVSPLTLPKESRLSMATETQPSSRRINFSFSIVIASEVIEVNSGEKMSFVCHFHMLVTCRLIQYYGEFMNNGPDSEVGSDINGGTTPTEADQFTGNKFIGGGFWLPSTGILCTSQFGSPAPQPS
ncbi:hypothetical protein ACLB2K_071765 [Fragaria x ananassa]